MISSDEIDGHDFSKYIAILTSIDSKKLRDIWFSQSLSELPIVKHIKELSKNYL